MTLIPGIRRLFRIGGVHDVESAVDDELRFHIDMTVRELMEAGMAEDEAKREAERRFGDVAGARRRLAALDRERVNAERRAEWWSALGQDLRYALRGLRLKPGFTVGVVLTLGLGIGANATMFGIVDRLLFRPPPYLSHSGRVHRLNWATVRDGSERLNDYTSYARLLDMQRFTRDFDVVAGASPVTLAVGTGESVSERLVLGVSANFFRLFEMRPALGRLFAADEDSVPETARVVVLGYGLWRTSFGGSPGVLGQQLRIGRNPYTIVGVAPPGFQGVGIETPAAIIPMTAMVGSEMGSGSGLRTYRGNTLFVVVRRRPGVAIDRAGDGMSEAFRRSYEQQRAERPELAPVALAKPRVVMSPVQNARGPNRDSDVDISIWLVGVSVIVLAITCANVANLLVARAFSRRLEMAVRLALGVGWARLLGQMLTESVVLALLGGAAGVLLAQWGGGALRAVLLPDVTWGSVLADTRVVVSCATVALLVGVVTGLAPAWYALRSDLAASLRGGDQEGAFRRWRSRAALLVVQGALSAVLLVGAGMFVRSLGRAQSVPLGFDADRVLLVVTELRGAAVPRVERGALQRRLQERAQSLPGVERAARQTTLPFGWDWSEELFVEGIDSLSRLGRFELNAVSPEYFATMGTRLLSGRGIGIQDRQGAPPVMVVSQSMARAIWPGREALGQCVRIGADTVPCTTVVGIAEDVKTRRLSGDRGLLYYLSIEQFDGSGSGGLFVRTRGEAAAAVEGVRRALQPLLPGTAYVTVTPLADFVASKQRSWQLGATMFTIFGALALLVASVGLYSVISYGVAQRSRELAVRTALGAQPRDVVRMVVGEGLRTVLVATTLGLAVAWLAARWVGPLLFQTSPRDPVIYGGVAVVLVVVALVASAIPAVRASRVDPIAALRAE